jgi:predicted enzyme related to lactoylglutathione lyase
MPEVTTHSPGAPSWVELSTTDESGALQFYSALFDWVDDPQPITDTWSYHMQKLNGLEAAAIYQQSQEEQGQGIPAHWNTYFTVADVDAVAAAIYQQSQEEQGQGIPAHWNTYFTVADVDAVAANVDKSGGAVLFGPMDVFDAGKMAMLQDPQGAAFAVWQPKQHIGARVKHDPGAMTWNELLTTDSHAATEFYLDLLGMERGQTMGPMDYTLLRCEGVDVAGVMEITPDMGTFPPHWAVYFGVSDVDVTVSQAQTLGASVIVPGTDIPEIGRFACLMDPQGAVFSVFTGA